MCVTKDGWGSVVMDVSWFDTEKESGPELDGVNTYILLLESRKMGMEFKVFMYGTSILCLLMYRVVNGMAFCQSTDIFSCAITYGHLSPMFRFVCIHAYHCSCSYCCSAGRVMSVAFDDQLIVSGCSQSVVRLWSMDELKSIKALRHHQGAVTALLLHNGMPLSGGEDGTVAAWDGSGGSSNPVVSWEVGGPVGAMAIADNSGEMGFRVFRGLGGGVKQVGHEAEKRHLVWGDG